MNQNPTKMKTTLKDKTKEKLEQWKSQAEQLNLQMHLGAAEARDEFERQKKELKNWLHETDQEIENLEKEGKHQYIELRRKIDELRVQAALGKAEAEDSLKEQQRNLARGIHGVKHELNQAVEKSDEIGSEVMEGLEDGIDHFRTRFDLFRLQLNLGASEAKDYWEEKKKTLSGKLHEINNKMEEAADKAEDKWEGFSEEMSHAWKHFRKAFE